MKSKAKENFDWNNVSVLLGGVEIPVKPIEFTPKETEPEVIKWEYYHKKKNNFYFRQANQKLVITSDDHILQTQFKRGEKYELKFKNKQSCNNQKQSSQF